MTLKLSIMSGVSFDLLNHVHGVCHCSKDGEYGMGPSRSERMKNLPEHGPQGPCFHCFVTLALTIPMVLKKLPLARYLWRGNKSC